MTVNSISSKYLGKPHEVAPFQFESEPSDSMSPKCCPGIYFSTKNCTISTHKGLYIKEFTDTSGQKWRLLTTSNLEWVRRNVERALGESAVPLDELSSAILFYYQLRDLLEAE